MMREDLRDGMTVYSADGEKLGKVVGREPDGFIIEKGLFFKKEFVVRYDDIERMGETDVYLSRTKAELESASRGERLENAVSASSAAVRGDERIARGRVTEEVRVPLAEEEVSARKQTHETGEVRIHKHVETETKHISVPVTHEEVRVERVAVEGGGTAPAAGEAGFQDTTVSIPVYEEEIEISKRPVIREEVRVTKESHEEERSIDTTVRKEKAEIEEEEAARPAKPRAA